MNDPRPQHKYNRVYTVDYLSNMVGGRKTLYNNQPIDFLKKMVAASIKDGEVGIVSVSSPLGLKTSSSLVWCNRKTRFMLTFFLLPSSISRLCGLAVMLENTSVAS